MLGGVEQEGESLEGLSKRGNAWSARAGGGMLEEWSWRRMLGGVEQEEGLLEG